MIVPEAIEAYARNHSSPEDPLLQELATETHAAMAHAGMQVGHIQGHFMRFLVMLSHARRVLEIGTFTGYSALAMASGLPDDGELITCDQDPDATAMARRYWARSPHGHKITLRLGPALDTVRTLEGPFDLVFLDADKENNPHYWEACLPLVRPGGLLLVDNVLWKGRILDPESPLDHAVHAFNETVSRDPRVEAVMVPIRDGITLARKR